MTRTCSEQHEDGGAATMEDTPWSLGPVVMLILPSSFHKAGSEPLGGGGGGVVPHLNQELTD